MEEEAESSSSPQVPQEKYRQQVAPQKVVGNVKSNIHDFYNNHYEFREMISLNVQLKARPLIAILFICAFVLIIYRLSKRSETAK